MKKVLLWLENDDDSPHSKVQVSVGNDKREK